MKINYLKTVGFRKFKKEFETEIYDVTKITGKNRSGKSNILYAIVNILLGTNLTGDERANLINRQCDASYEELHFTDDKGTEHVIVRGKDRYSNKNNFLMLDGKSASQEDLVSFYKDKKLFLSVINPLYFLNKSPAEQKKLIDKYLSDLIPNSETVCMEKAYNSLEEQEKKILEVIPKDIPKYITEINDEIKRNASNISVLDGKIEYAKNIINEEIPESKIFNKAEELSLAEQEISFLKMDEKIVDKEKQKTIVENLQKEILSKETELNSLNREMQEGKKKYMAIKAGNTCICPTCNQHIQDESKNTTIANMHKELLAKYDKNNVLETQIKDLKFELTVEKCKLYSLDSNSTIEKAKRMATVEENIELLKREKLEVEKFNNEIETKKKIAKDTKLHISEFKNKKQSLKELIENLEQTRKIAQKLYIAYIEEKLRFAKQHLKDVNIQFYSILKTTGEIQSDFIITYKGKPLTDLSRSETIATALEFANMFNKICKVNFPIFIDDYESCADYDFIKEYAKNTQVIVAEVKKGNSLKIADANSNNYTVIKPVIKRYRSMKPNKNTVAETVKAA